MDKMVQNQVRTVKTRNQKIKQTHLKFQFYQSYNFTNANIQLFHANNISNFSAHFPLHICVYQYFLQSITSMNLEDSCIIDQLAPIQHHYSDDDDLFYQSGQPNYSSSFKPQAKKNTKKKIKKGPKKRRTSQQANYRKNICGYITKKIIREFTSDEFKNTVFDLCRAHKTSYSETREHYLTTIQRVTGPSHLLPLFTSTNQVQLKYKMVFRQFFIWFLKERYIRYLLSDGKMLRKEDYIRYKNESLFKLLNEPQFIPEPMI